MNLPGSTALALGGVLSAAASLAHVACIFLGAPAYRLMGAGERMAQAAERGSFAPAVSTGFIALVLAVWALYAFSAAGMVQRLPLLRFVLVAVTGVYLARALAFPMLRSVFPGNSTTFWIVSSGICFLIGSIHLFGLVRAWGRL